MFYFKLFSEPTKILPGIATLLVDVVENGNLQNFLMMKNQG
jgi:hypothetical protein